MGREGVQRRDGRLAFGLNWAAYAGKIGEPEIAQAVAGLRRLLGGMDLARARVLDLGCGSGVHSVAVLRLGAAAIVAVDIDPTAVATATAVLGRYAPGAEWRVEQADVLEMSPARWGRFDLVYAWGVLHHTGDLRRAMRSAALLVEPGGRTRSPFTVGRGCVPSGKWPSAGTPAPPRERRRWRGPSTSNSSA